MGMISCKPAAARRKKMIVVFVKVLDDAMCGHLECAAEDLLVRRDLATIVLTSGQSRRVFSTRPTRCSGAIGRRPRRKRTGMEAVAVLQISVQMMQVSVDFHPVAVPTIEKAVEADEAERPRLVDGRCARRDVADRVFIWLRTVRRRIIQTALLVTGVRIPQAQ